MTESYEKKERFVAIANGEFTRMHHLQSLLAELASLGRIDLETRYAPTPGGKNRA